MHFFELPAFLLWTSDSPNAVHCSKLVSNCDTIYNNDVFSFYLKIVWSKVYYHRHIWIRFNSRIDTTELLMYFRFSVPKIEKSNFLIFRENIFFSIPILSLIWFCQSKMFSCLKLYQFFCIFLIFLLLKYRLG